MSPTLWKLEAIGPREFLDPAAEIAADVDPPFALAVMLFDAEPGMRRLELLFDHMPDVDAVREAIGAQDRRVEMFFGPVDDEDWVTLSLKHFPPVIAGRFRLHGCHDAPAPGGTVNLLIEAGEAFGTGHHGTTKGCLMMFSDLLKRARPARVLDVGTGTGALALAAAKTLRRPVMACDIDEDSVRVAAENAHANGAGGLVEAFESDALNHPRLRGRAFDLIFANILAGPLVQMSSALLSALAPGGRLILSGLLARQERVVAGAFLARGARRERRLILDDWATLMLRKP